MNPFPSTELEWVIVYAVLIIGGLYLVARLMSEIMGLFHGSKSDDIPADNYHPDAGKGVRSIGMNSQPLPNASTNELLSAHSNGWTRDKRTGIWNKDTGDMYGYFKDGKFLKFKK